MTDGGGVGQQNSVNPDARDAFYIALLQKDDGGREILKEQLKHDRHYRWAGLAVQVITASLATVLVLAVVAAITILVINGHPVEGGLLGLFNGGIAAATAWGRRHPREQART